jgi:hypothetical protein
LKGFKNNLKGFKDYLAKEEGGEGGSFKASFLKVLPKREFFGDNLLVQIHSII